MLESSHSSEFEKLRMIHKENIQKLEGLPTLPEIVLELQRIVGEDKLSAGEIAPIIDKDPSLAVKLLKIVNSAYYGRTTKLDSLRQAIVVVGIKGISNLILGISIVHAFNIDEKSEGFNWKEYWEHSNLVGNIAEILNSKLKLWIPASPFTLGLLHDIGKLVLYKLDPEKYKKSLNFALENEVSSIYSEVEYFGINHMEAGRWIAQKWELPEATQYAIGYHHTPEETPSVESQLAVKLIKLSDLILNYHGVRFGNSLSKEKLKNGFIEFELFDNVNFNGSIDEIQEIIHDIDDYIEALRQMITF